MHGDRHLFARHLMTHPRYRPRNSSLRLVAKVLEYPDVEIPLLVHQVRQLAEPLRHQSLRALKVGDEVVVIGEDRGETPKKSRRRSSRKLLTDNTDDVADDASSGILTTNRSSKPDAYNAYRMAQLRGHISFVGRRGHIVSIDFDANVAEVEFTIPQKAGRREQTVTARIREQYLQFPSRLNFWHLADNEADSTQEGTGNNPNVSADGPTRCRINFDDRSRRRSRPTAARQAVTAPSSVSLRQLREAKHARKTQAYHERMAQQDLDNERQERQRRYVLE